MVADAVKIVLTDFPVPDTGSFRIDCESYLDRAGAVFADPRALPVITQLINEGARDPDLAQALRSRLVAPRREALLELIDRGVARGQLPVETDRETLADLLVAPLYYRALVTGEPIGSDLPHRIVHAVLDHDAAL
jgi:hypothetical protein